MTDCPPCNRNNPNQFIKLEPEDLLLSMAIDGIVVDPERAKQGPCRCVPTPHGKLLCWDHGIVGALSQDQVETYCKNITEAKLPARLNQRFQLFTKASKECEIGRTWDSPNGPVEIKSLEDRLQCMHVEASNGR